jgi:phosphoribosylanthranilate isomerase
MAFAMRHPRVKICGMRSEEDLRIAVEAGADAVGLICGVEEYVSEDQLTARQASSLARQVPPFVAKVLVTHHTDPDEILSLAELIGVDTIQLHGDVTPEEAAEVYGRRAGRRVTQRVHVTGPEAVELALEFSPCCDAIHLDSRTADRIGGTGHTHDWSISRQIVDLMAERAVPVILAGGLTPENVRRAIEIVQPYAVDVNSGVEFPSGDKSPDRASFFVAEVKATAIASTPGWR